MAVSLNKYLVSYLNFESGLKDYKAGINWKKYSQYGCNISSSMGKFRNSGVLEINTDDSRSFIYTNDIKENKVYIRFWIKFITFNYKVSFFNYKDIVALYSDSIENKINGEKENFGDIRLKLNRWYFVKLELDYSKKYLKYKLDISVPEDNIIYLNKLYDIDSKSYIDISDNSVKLGSIITGGFGCYIDEFAIFKDVDKDNKFDFDKFDFKDQELSIIIEKEQYEEDEYNPNDYLVSCLDFEDGYDDYKDNIYWVRNNGKYIYFIENIGKFGNSLYVNKTITSGDAFIVTPDIKESSVYIRFWIYFLEKNNDVCIFNFKDIVKVYCDKINAFGKTYNFSSDLQLQKWYFFKINITYTSLIKFLTYNIESNDNEIISDNFNLKELNPIISSATDPNPDITEELVKIGGMGENDVSSSFYMDEIAIFKDIGNSKFNFDKYAGKEIILSTILSKEEKKSKESNSRFILKNSLLSHIDFDYTFADNVIDRKWKAVNANENDISKSNSKFKKAFHINTVSKKYIFINSINETQVFVRFWLYLEKPNSDVCIFNFKNILKFYYNKIIVNYLDPAELNLELKTWYLIELKIDYSEYNFNYNCEITKYDDNTQNLVDTIYKKSVFPYISNEELPDKSLSAIKLGATTDGFTEFYIDDFSIFRYTEELDDIFNNKKNVSINYLINGIDIEQNNTSLSIDNINDYLVSYLSLDEDYYDYKANVIWKQYNPLCNNIEESMGKFKGCQYFSTINNSSYLYTNSIRNTNVKIRFWIYFERINPDICILDFKDVVKVYCDRIESKYNGTYAPFDLQLNRWHYFEIDFKYQSNYCSFIAKVIDGNIYSAGVTIQTTIPTKPLVYMTKLGDRLPNIGKNEIKLGIINSGTARFYIDEFAIFDSSQDSIYNVSDYISKDTKLSDILIREKREEYEDNQNIGSINDYLLSYLDFNHDYEDYKSNIEWRQYNSYNNYISKTSYKFTGAQCFNTQNNISYLYTDDIKDTNVYIRFWINFEKIDPNVCIFNYKNIVKVYCNRIEGYEKTCEFSPELVLNCWYFFKINIHYSLKSIIWICYIFNDDKDDLYSAKSLMNEVKFGKKVYLPNRFNSPVLIGASTIGTTIFYIDEFAIFKNLPKKEFPYETNISKDIVLGTVLTKEPRKLKVTRDQPNSTLCVSKYVKSHLPCNENPIYDIYKNKWNMFGKKIQIIDNSLHIYSYDKEKTFIRTDDICSSNFTIGYWLKMNFDKSPDNMRYIWIGNFLEVYPKGFIFHLPDWSSANEENFVSSHYIGFNRIAFKNNEWVYICIYLKLDVENKTFEIAYKIKDKDAVQLTANSFIIQKPNYEFRNRYTHFIAIGMTNNTNGDFYIKDFQYTTDKDQYEIFKSSTLDRIIDLDVFSGKRLSGITKRKVLKTITTKTNVGRKITRNTKIVYKSKLKPVLSGDLCRTVKENTDNIKIFYMRLF